MADPIYGKSRLPELLKKRRMSQAEFSRRLDVSEAYVTQIIKGKMRFSLIKAKSAANILKCSIEDLYEWL